jgi:hypothetical protein
MVWGEKTEGKNLEEIFQEISWEILGGEFHNLKKIFNVFMTYIFMWYLTVDNQRIAILIKKL